MLIMEMGMSRLFVVWCNKRDIDKSWEAVQYAKQPRIHTFIATIEIHMKYKLKKTREEVVEKARSMVAYARSLGCNDVEFSPEDAGRSDTEFLYHILGEVIKAGATTLNIADTVGYTLQSEFGQLIAGIKANSPELRMWLFQHSVRMILDFLQPTLLQEHLQGHGEQLLGGLHTGISRQLIIMASKMVDEYSVCPTTKGHCWS